MDDGVLCWNVCCVVEVEHAYQSCSKPAIHRCTLKSVLHVQHLSLCMPPVLMMQTGSSNLPVSHYLFVRTALLSSTDRHSSCQHMLICSASSRVRRHRTAQAKPTSACVDHAQVVQYTPRGRAWNRNSGTLGGTANAAFLALAYSKFARQQHEYNQLQKRYVCWARGQLRYMLGGAGRSLVVGYGVNPPVKVQNEAASCNPSPTVCNAVSCSALHECCSRSSFFDVLASLRMHCVRVSDMPMSREVIAILREHLAPATSHHTITESRA